MAIFVTMSQRKVRAIRCEQTACQTSRAVGGGRRPSRPQSPFLGETPLLQSHRPGQRRAPLVPVAPQPKGDKAADDKAAEDYQKNLAAWKGNKKARDEAWVRWKKLLAGV